MIVSWLSSGDNFIKTGFIKCDVARVTLRAAKSGSKFSLECKALKLGVLGEEILTVM